MKFFLSAALVACMGFDALAAPTMMLHRQNGRSFKVARVRRAVAHGPSALRRAYQKYGIVPTDLGLEFLDFKPLPVASGGGATAVDAAAPATGTGAVKATAVQGGAEFVCPVTIGGQTMMMDFDTGSSDLWVVNTNLPAAAQQGHTAFNPTKSNTFQTLNGAQFNISYGDGSFATGPVGTDTVSIGNATVTKQAIGIPTVISQSFIKDTASNGLVGLAFSNINTIQPVQQKTFFDNVEPTLAQPVLTAALKSDGTGEYEFGVIDQAKFQGQMVNVSVDPANGFWQFQSAQFQVGNAAVQPMTTAKTAIADTGTTLMLAAPEVVQAYYSQVPGAVLASNAGGVIYPCNAQLPSLSVAVGGSNLATIPGSLITFNQIGTNTTTGQALCFGGLQSNQGIALQIYGDVFLRSMFVVFDKRGPSLGFASPA